MLVIMSAAALLAASATGPTYLSCVLEGANGPLSLKITADEANQTATLELLSTGAVDRRPAVFSASSVTFTVPLGSVATIQYDISRVDLTITRTLSGAVHNTTTGKCKVETAPTRAF